MWVFDLGNKDGLAKYAILYSPSLEEAEEWAYKLNARVTYCIERVADIHLPNQSDPIFYFKGRIYYETDGYDLGDCELWTTNRYFFIIEEYMNKEMKRFLEVKEKHPECFTIKEEIEKHLFKPDTKVLKISLNKAILDKSDDFREYQVSNFKIRYLDDVNNRWMC